MVPKFKVTKTSKIQSILHDFFIVICAAVQFLSTNAFWLLSSIISKHQKALSEFHIESGYNYNYVMASITVTCCFW